MPRRNSLNWEALEGKYEPVPWSGCWLWTKSKNPKGYGVALVAGARYMAHRLAYTLARGPIPDGLLVCHRCDVPECINPAHLFIGTAQANHDDAVAKGRKQNQPFGTSKRTKQPGYCWRWHELTAANTYTRPSGAIDCRACIKARPSDLKNRKRVSFVPFSIMDLWRQSA